MNSIETLISNLQEYQYDPTRAMREVLAVAQDISNGRINLVDPTNPVVLCIESAACLYSAFMDEHASTVRRLYPQLAQTESELYLHMSDKDYVGRFATPSKARFGILVAEDELLNRMVEDPSTKSRKLVIPRNTYFVAGGYTFSLQYPIIISQLQHEGLRIVYDVSKPSPLLTLDTNLVDWEYAESVDGVRYVRLFVDTQQFEIKSKQESTTLGKEFSMAMPFEREFYYARVYAETDTGWQEIATTHSEQVYDPTVITAVLRVVNKTLQVRIPQIYTNTILSSRKIRVDLYQTYGKLELDLAEYPSDEFGVTWMSYDKSEETVYTAPMNNFQQLIPFPVSAVTGGSVALPLHTLRERVIKNTTGVEIEYPISTVQLETKLEQNGYGVVLEVDNITERVFLATKPMPEPSDKKLLTAAAAAIESVSVEMNKLALLDTVINNGTALTITPDTLYRQINGVTSPVSKSEVDVLLAMPPEKRALAVSQSNWRFNPFHYVLDSSGTEFDLRPYHLDAPEALSKTFVAENATTLLQISTAAYGVFRVGSGYMLQIVTNSSETVRNLPDEEIFVQLAFVPSGERERAYLNGRYVGRNASEERIYEFDLATNFHVNSENLLQLTKFLMYSNEARLTGVGLTTEFDILYAVSTPMDTQWVPSDIDEALGRLFLPAVVAGVTHEKLKIKFGNALKTLWSRSRSYTLGTEYEKHAVDVPLYYDKDVYELVDGSPVQFDANGQVVFNVLHAAGTPVLNANGEPVYKYRAGDIKVDTEGKPIAVSGRGVRRVLDLFMVDGTYWFANDVTTVNYRKELTKKVVDWLVNDLANLSKKVLEKTRVYFYPKTTLGMIDVSVGNGLTKSIQAEQSFVLRLAVPSLVYRDNELRKQLEAVSIRTLSEQLENTTVADSAINQALAEQYGDDVISFRVSGLGGAEQLSSLRVLSEANRCSLRKRLVALADGTLVTREDVSVEFDLME